MYNKNKDLIHAKVVAQVFSMSQIFMKSTTLQWLQHQENMCCKYQILLAYYISNSSTLSNVKQKRTSQIFKGKRAKQETLQNIEHPSNLLH